MVFKIKIKVNEDIHLFELEPTKKIIDLKMLLKNFHGINRLIYFMKTKFLFEFR